MSQQQHSHTHVVRPTVLGPGVAIGLGTTVAMWAAAFLAHLPGLNLEPAWVGVALVGLQFAAVLHGARLDGRAFVGTLAGLVSALANLLVVGSLVSERAAPGLEGLREHAVPFALGSIGLGAALGTVAGVVGARLHAPTKGHAAGPDASGSPWLFRFSCVAALAILPLLFIGGLVTSTQSGMAVPDWPTSYSANMFLFPLKAMTGGIYYEHAHRLFGALVGLVVLCLTVWVWLGDRRGWVRFFATAVLVGICIQGLIGGIRVTQNSTLLAMVHGTFAQLIFGAACALAATLSPSFRDAPPAATGEPRPRVRGVATALLACMAVQLAFGAATRHFPPPERGWHSVGSHIVLALVVAVLVVVVSARGKRLRGAPGPTGRVLARLATGLTHALGLQLLLGVAALTVVLLYGKHPPTAMTVVVLTTLHQFNGAVLLAMGSLVMVWARRLNA